jgi:HEPN domain-containing protein
MNRDDLRRIARLRLREAHVLLRSEHYQGAYYLCGYVIECGLKSCIAKQTRRYDFPEKKTVDASYTHDLTKLVKVAGLQPVLEQEMKDDPVFGVNWLVVKDWSEESRYQERTKREAHDLYAAITNRTHGVLRWIKQHW